MKITLEQLRGIIQETIDDITSDEDILGEDELEEVAPPGWEETVKQMKDDPEIDNPYALAWHMKKKGAKPGYGKGNGRRKKKGD